MKFFEAWAHKGLITKYRSQWSAVVDSRYVFTVWNQPYGETEVFFTKERGAFFSVKPNDGLWHTTKPGKDFIARALHCLEHSIPGEVILLQGKRDARPSKTESADISDNLFYIHFTKVDPVTGEMEAYFTNRAS